MTWNWEQSDWPNFTWNSNAIAELEAQFKSQSLILTTSIKHLTDENKDILRVEMMTDEAIKTSEIENEILNRDSVQSSIRRHLGLKTDNARIPPEERGIAELMVELAQHFAKPLTQTTLFNWHKLVTLGRADLIDIGRYRTGEEPMQVISRSLEEVRVHFEAPPSKDLKREMDGFLAWYEQTAPGKKEALPPLTRSAITHLYFVSIHPFEDGNGRISRALAGKSLSESLGHPSLTALSLTITRNKKAYYDALELNNKDNEITHWIKYFAETILEAQAYTQGMIDFLIEKTKFWDRFRGQFNERQEKTINRMFKEGPEGFKGGLSADNYLRITGTTRATATRDLQDLVDKGALLKTGQLKSTRYHLIIGAIKVEKNKEDA